MLNNGQGYSGFFDLTAFGSGYNAQAFMVKSILSKISTATICKVVGVTNAGGVAGSGFVNVQPLVNMVDGSGNAFPHGVIYKCAYNRVQGGTNAIILDPQVGDIGLVVFADRDISSAINTRVKNMGQPVTTSNPGSNRMYDMSDGLYVFSIVTAAPTQYVEFSSAGIAITSPTKVSLNAPNVTITAPVTAINASTSVTITTPTFTVNGNTVLTGTAVANGVDIGSTHAHQVSGVQAGTSTIETSTPNI